LLDAGCIKFGSFTLKSGLTSPVYVDLRLLVSEPSLLGEAAQEMARVAGELAFDRIAAIPYAGLPIGVALALAMNRPLIYPRREVKEHGTRQPIEGAFREGEVALVIDDVITRGGSKLEAIGVLEDAGLAVHDVLVLIDREQGGRDDLADRGYRLHSLYRLADMIEALHSSGDISEPSYVEVMNYLRPAS
jgi:uridine monophosphate synthetase